LVPEAYLDSKEPSPEQIEGGIEQLVRDSVAFVIKFKQEGNVHDES